MVLMQRIHNNTFFSAVTRKFGMKTCCAGCVQPIGKDDYVMKARDNVYHVACFSCAICRFQLKTGEQFGMRDNYIFCQVSGDDRRASFC